MISGMGAQENTICTSPNLIGQDSALRRAISFGSDCWQHQQTVVVMDEGPTGVIGEDIVDSGASSTSGIRGRLRQAAWKDANLAQRARRILPGVEVKLTCNWSDLRN